MREYECLSKCVICGERDRVYFLFKYVIGERDTHAWADYGSACSGDEPHCASAACGADGSHDTHRDWCVVVVNVLAVDGELHRLSLKSLQREMQGVAPAAV